MQAVILAGGKGTRLAERLKEGQPKPLVEVCGTSLLERQLATLEANGIEDVVVLINHGAEQIERFFGNRRSAIKATLIDDGEPRGTAGATLACLDQLADRFVIVYGDTLFDIDIMAMLKVHVARQADATLFLHPNDHPQDSDLVEIDTDGMVRAFHSYPHSPDAELHNLVNAAFYIVERCALEPWRDLVAPNDFARDLFPAMVVAGQRLFGYVSHEYIKDLGTPARLDKVERHLSTGVVSRARRRTPQRIVFLDRDGTLNKPFGHIAKPSDLILLPGAAQAVRRFNDAEIRTVLATNQPVVSRGQCSLDGLSRIHARLETLLGVEGAYLDRIEFCPHHPDTGFAGEIPSLKIACNCRKPGTLMLERGMAALNGDPAQAWMIGDSSADCLAANRARILSILVRTGEDEGCDSRYPGVPDFIRADLTAAAHLVLDEFPRLALLAQPIAARVAPGDAIAIGGLARFGKTGFAAVLRHELQVRGIAALTVSLDSWIRAEDDRALGIEGRFDLDGAGLFFNSWFAGGALRGSAPHYDRYGRTKTMGDMLTLPIEGVLIVEGVPALAMEWNGRRVHRVALVGNEAARRERVVSDLVARGATLEAARRTYRDRRCDEGRFVTRSLENADFTVSIDAASRGSDT